MLILKNNSYHIRKLNKINFHFYFKNRNPHRTINNMKYMNNLLLFNYMEETNKNENQINLKIKDSLNHETSKINNEKDISTKNLIKEKVKIDKKTSRKLAKAIHVLNFHESEQDSNREIFSSDPTLNIWVYHFGNGDEDDQKAIKNLFSDNLGECKVYMFPGISYGFMEFNDIEAAKKLIPQNENKANFENKNKNTNPNIILNKKENDDIIHSAHDIKFISGERKLFVFYSKISLSEVQANSNSTFPIASYKVDVPGLYLIDNFITPEEEQILIKNIDDCEWTKLTNRRVQHYGYEFIYGANNVNKNNKIGELPEFGGNLSTSNIFIFRLFFFVEFKNLLQNFIKKEEEEDVVVKIGEIYELEQEDTLNNPNSDIANNTFKNKTSFYDKFGNFDQLTINDYTPGEGIPPHWDSHSPFEDVFCALSLYSGVVMTFLSPLDVAKHVYIKPRSLIIFTGEARYIWQHSISLRKLDRVEDNIFNRHRRLSLTFRKIRISDCKCPFIKFCDSQQAKLTAMTTSEALNIKLPNEEALDQDKDNVSHKGDGLPTEIEKKHVYDVYEKIAPHFSNTRYKPWPRVAEYLNNLAPGSLNADVGCGNGKYLNVNEKVVTIGTDRSFNLISICREKNNNNQVFVADSLKLPLRSNAFDSAISIAVVHHFSNVELRLKALKEIIRILRPGGTFLIYVWALEQDDNKFKQQDNFVPWHLTNTFEDKKQIETLGPENIRDEKKNATVYHRYYHMFKNGELENLIKTLPNVSIVDSYYDHENWCCIIKKEF